ncbi:hypothetical protein CGRA01v4_09629 [Colletotrichum graminicola]|nr:hypothetical protein CGRA01v4_09629 [Colletotrichum graminicola]
MHYRKVDEPLFAPPTDVPVAALAASRKIQYLALSRRGKPREEPGWFPGSSERVVLLYASCQSSGLVTQSHGHIRRSRICLPLLRVPSSHHVRWTQSTASMSNHHMCHHHSSQCRLTQNAPVFLRGGLFRVVQPHFRVQPTRY